jgi:hypothetical protein
VNLEDLPIEEVELRLRAAARSGPLDELISAGARAAQRALTPLDAGRWASALGPLRVRLAGEFAADCWQARTLELALAQLHGRAGEHEACARAWFRFREIAPHRAGEATHAGLEALLAAGRIDEWLELHSERRLTPGVATRMKSADVLGQRILREGLPLLVSRLGEKPVSADVLRVVGVPSSLLEELTRAGFAPDGARFHDAFPDQYDLHTLFDGVLALPPAQPAGFFITTVEHEGKRTPSAARLLESARATRFQGGSIHATWNTPHTIARASKPKGAPPLPPKEQRTFARAVKTLVRRRGSEAVTRFSALTHADLSLAVAEFDPGWFAKGHNRAPAISALLAATRAHAATTTFSGGVVWPPRADRRIYVDGVTTRATPKTSGWKKTADEYEREGELVHVWWD